MSERNQKNEYSLLSVIFILLAIILNLLYGEEFTNMENFAKIAKTLFLILSIVAFVTFSVIELLNIWNTDSDWKKICFDK